MTSLHAAKFGKRYRYLIQRIRTRYDCKRINIIATLFLSLQVSPFSGMIPAFMAASISSSRCDISSTMNGQSIDVQVEVTTIPTLLANNSAETFENLGPRLSRRLSTALTRSISSPVLIAVYTTANGSETEGIGGWNRRDLYS